MSKFNKLEVKYGQKVAVVTAVAALAIAGSTLLGKSNEKEERQPVPTMIDKIPGSQQSSNLLPRDETVPVGPAGVAREYPSLEIPQAPKSGQS